MLDWAQDKSYPTYMLKLLSKMAAAWIMLLIEILRSSFDHRDIEQAHRGALPRQQPATVSSSFEVNVRDCSIATAYHALVMLTFFHNCRTCALKGRYAAVRASWGSGISQSEKHRS